MNRHLWCGFVIWFLLPTALAQVAPFTLAHEDPSKIKTAKTCRRCHVTAYNVWEKTPHASGFKTLHRKEAALNIAKKMGVDLIKRESLCLNCHYTATESHGELKAESGVSCESCHGAAADWVDLHNNYGGAGATFATETAEHRKNRIEQTRKLGMRRPSDLYAVAARCFQCHTVPHEQLVNTGGHGTGSASFEFVAWSQGEMRHNFLDSFRTGDGTVNAQRTNAQKRRMYVLGRMLDLEYSVRGVAVARDQQRYFKAMERRVRSAVGELRALYRAAPLPQLSDAVARVAKARILPNKEKELLALADDIGKLAKDFLAAHDGGALAAIDGLVRGDPQPEPPSIEAEADDAGVSATAVTTTAPSANQGAPPSTAATAPTATAKAAPFKVEGDKKNRLRPAPAHPIVGPGECSSCHRHEPQSRWWFDDPHYRSADPFLNGSPKVLEIARNYGISANQLSRGTTLCMDCHGTVISGRESRDVTDGVGCESCHGAAGDYLKSHQEGDAALGHERPAYKDALKRGMAATNDAKVRARMCADCHYITDPRLLSSGHGSGANFDVVAATAKIKHWPKPYLDNASLKTAYATELQRRGPVPNVRRPPATTIVQPAGVSPTTTVQPLAATKSDVQASNPPSSSNNGQSPAPDPSADTQTATSDGDAAIQTPGPVQLTTAPPDPLLGQTLEETLLLIKKRLEQLHEKSKKGGHLD